MTISRPDITFDVHYLSQFVAAPRASHLQAAHHLFHCLKGQPGQALLFSASSLQLRGFFYADWGTCKDFRRSIIAFCVFLRGSLILWKSKKQYIVSRSSTEAEYLRILQKNNTPSILK